MKGFHYFSSGCRAKGKRGGGAAVIINVKKIPRNQPEFMCS